MPGRGPLRVPTINIRPQIASHDISWVLGAHVCFGSLDFIITVGGELALAHAAIQPLPSIGLDTVNEVVEELQLNASRAHAPRNN